VAETALEGTAGLGVEVAELETEGTGVLSGATTVHDPGHDGFRVDPDVAFRKPEGDNEPLAGQDRIGWRNQHPTL
jgi:hypothetical protein